MNIIELKQTIALPEGVSASLSEMLLTVKGPKGEVARDFANKQVALAITGEGIEFSAREVTRKEKMLLFTYVAHAKNLVKGVTEGHLYKLKICSGHFPMNVALKGKELEIKNFIGESVPRLLKIKEGAEVKLEGTEITVTGINKEIVAQVAADIEQMTRRPGFDSRIFQDGIYMTEKDGKQLS